MANYDYIDDIAVKQNINHENAEVFMDQFFQAEHHLLEPSPDSFTIVPVYVSCEGLVRLFSTILIQNLDLLYLSVFSSFVRMTQKAIRISQNTRLLQILTSDYTIGFSVCLLIIFCKLIV